MTSIDLATHKEALLAKKQRVVEELSTIAIYHADTDDWEAKVDTSDLETADDDLIGDSLEAAEEQVATLALLETDYRNIVRALDKLEAGNYGICEICSGTIEADRLLVNPAARTCKTHMNEDGVLPL